MKATPLFSVVLGYSLVLSLANAQQSSSQGTSAIVPRMVNFSGKVTDARGKVISGIAGVTFAIYKDQYGGSPLWLETQKVQADAKGDYTVQLGAPQSGKACPLIFSLRGRRAGWGSP